MVKHPQSRRDRLQARSRFRDHIHVNESKKHKESRAGRVWHKQAIIEAKQQEAEDELKDYRT